MHASLYAYRYRLRYKKTLEITEQLSNNTFSIAYTLVFESTTLKLKYKLSNL